MISHADVERLCARQAVPGSPVLSVYLDVDQSRAANLNRDFETALHTRLRELESEIPPEERDSFAADTARVLRFVAGYRPAARGLMIFADESEDLFWTGELQAPLTTGVHWDDRPHIRPLLELCDEYERYGVILVDKERARVFTVFLGAIEEEREAVASAEVRHKNASGTDHLRSQMNFQRQDEMHVRWHLKTVAELTDELARAQTFDRLVLAGPVAATSELQRLLPKRLRARVVGTLRLPIDASLPDVLRETLVLEQAAERSLERERVEALLTAAGKGDGGVVGLEATLEAVQERRVWRLLYSAGYESRGDECPRCGALFPSGRAQCGYCASPLQPVDDLVERAIRRVADGGGDVDQVHEAAATRLWDAGGIGAVLRF